MLKCPKCEHSLKEITYKEVKINECDNCKGKWFDRDELRKAKDRTDDDLRWLDFDLFDDNADKYHASPSQRKCPKDSTPMTSLQYMGSKVAIDKCNTCEGVWLDSEEFEKIIKYLENIVISKPASVYAKETVKEFSEILTGPENRISEIKDFLSVLWFFQLRLAVENPWTIELSDKINKYSPIR
ncbi:MAG: zf-TFIIB domain-containing protein [Candidatus Curtissbacteria bacterium]|nr:zf-TFIIB domain-containing protein [Candidatus Curtissbacteria bacterium]